MTNSVVVTAVPTSVRRIGQNAGPCCIASQVVILYPWMVLSMGILRRFSLEAVIGIWPYKDPLGGPRCRVLLAESRRPLKPPYPYFLGAVPGCLERE